MSDYERKFIRCDLKMDGEHTFSGVASPYGNVDLGGDVVSKGAFTQTLNLMGNKRKMLWQHRPDRVIGSVALKDTAEALLVERGEIDVEMAAGPEAYRAVKKGYVEGLSIGYMPVKWEWQKSNNPDDWPLRVLKEVKLYEVSIVTFPMNESAVITSVKSGTAAAYEFWNNEIKAGRLDHQMVADQLEKLTALLSLKMEAAPDAREPVDHSRLVGLIDEARESLGGTRTKTN